MKPEHLAAVITNGLNGYPDLAARYDPPEDETVDGSVGVYRGTVDTGWHIQVCSDGHYMVAHFDKRRGVLRDLGDYEKPTAAAMRLVKEIIKSIGKARAA